MCTDLSLFDSSFTGAVLALYPKPKFRPVTYQHVVRARCLAQSRSGPYELTRPPSVCTFLCRFCHIKGRPKPVREVWMWTIKPSDSESGLVLISCNPPRCVGEQRNHHAVAGIKPDSVSIVVSTVGFKHTHTQMILDCILCMWMQVPPFTPAHMCDG